MSKKASKTTTSVAEVEKKVSMNDTPMSTFLSVEAPGQRLNQCKTKEDYDNLFKDYNQLFLTIKNEMTVLDKMSDKVIDYLNVVQQTYRKNIGVEDDDLDDIEGDGEEGEGGT